MDSLVAVHNLHKSFGHTQALAGLDLNVAPGEIHGFLGPNGAGKTTTLRVLLGLLRADAGRATVLGGDPWTDAVRLHRRLAYVPGDVALWPSLSGGETIDLLVRLRGDRIDPAQRAELIERFALDPTKKNRAYSRGNRQKVALIAALCGDVELYLFDEPSAGLDPLMEAVFRESLRRLRADGRTILLSSHVLAEVEAVCDRVTIIRSGRAVESGTLTELRHLTRTSIHAHTVRPLAEVIDPDELAALSGVHELSVEDEPAGGSRLRCEVEAGGLDRLLVALGQAGVVSLESRPPTLEELFMRHYGPNGSDGHERHYGPNGSDGHDGHDGTDERERAGAGRDEDDV